MRTTSKTHEQLINALHGRDWLSVRAYKRARQKLLDELEPNRSLQVPVKSMDDMLFVPQLKRMLGVARRQRRRELKFRFDAWLGLYSNKSAITVFLLFYFLPLMTFAGFIWIITH